MKKPKEEPLLDKYLKDVEHLEKKMGKQKNMGDFLRENRYLYSLLEITHLINTPRDYEQLLELIVDSAINITRAERGFLMLYRKDGNLEFKVSRNIDKKTLEGEEFKVSRSVVNKVLATAEPIFAGAIYKETKLKISESIATLGLRMVMCVPLKTKDHLSGVIYVDSHSETEDFSRLEERLLEAFAGQASVAIENSRLFDSSVHDGLTGLYNYGFLRGRLEEEISRSQRYKQHDISFIMLDIDKFKSINDSYGHTFGNMILTKVAELLKNSIRKSDTPARYGGDEFAVLMPETTVHGALQLAQRIRKEINEQKFTSGTASISITTSIGISTFPVDKVVSSEDIIVEADHALFIAKGKGANQIVVFGLRKDERPSEFELFGTSKATEQIKKSISKLAKTDATILITGETGTGKELVTRLIHLQSVRAHKPFVVVNCGAIPDNLLESELFGYEKGAFTGAYAQHKGKFESAQTGTIFLDEIGELPLHLQMKILRALEQKEIDRIGGKEPIKVNVRVIAATNKNLEEEVKKGNFRSDLYYRLSVATVHIPPLRERPEDIQALSKHYLDQINKRYRRKFAGFTTKAMEAMLNHAWPGNVRELIHRIERAVIMGTGDYLNENSLGLVVQKLRQIRPLRDAKDEIEKDQISFALMYDQWNISHAAKALGITRKTLGALIKKHHIEKPK